MNCLRMDCSTGICWIGPFDRALATFGEREIFDVATRANAVVATENAPSIVFENLV